MALDRTKILYVATANSPESTAAPADGPLKWNIRLWGTWETWTRRGYLAIAQLVIGVVAASAAVGALWVLYRADQRQQNVDRTRDLLTRADQLVDSHDASLRVGGINSLGQVARDSKTDRSMVLEVLAAYVRSHAPIAACSPSSAPGKKPDVDVQAALTVIGQFGNDRDHPINLANSCLRGADLQNASLRWADLSGANLTNATMYRVNLSAANLTGAQLSGAAIVGGATLGWADLSSAVLTDAILGPPSETDLQNITYNSDTAWPAGFVPPPSHG
ncbi:MAG: hypothetical protein QOK02_3194 [Mycobacterium sp.]|nr:hypothetical protein [Mycobacterium sp.]